ncbi:MAG: biotin--[acetyl-CoA-carboxylase] ligase [Microscillaceae bacterium]|nr:biotin--[acetyl-CoA-carboxylase] ligase [Microscillaceae bacterium]
MQNLIIDTLFIGQKIIYLPTCQSTNTYALDLLADDSVLEGTTVITSHQTAGRGQRGNTWEAEPDQNLTFSTILMPNFLPIVENFYLNMAVALGIQQFLENYLGSGVKIKWPNDILYNRQKICGVLIENIIRKTIIEKSVVGIGVNINQTRFGVDTATSLKNIMGRDFHLEPLLAQLLKSLEEQYLILRQKDHKQLKINYLHKLIGYQESLTYQVNDQYYEGKIMDIETSGKLKLEINNEIRSFDFKEISFVY